MSRFAVVVCFVVVVVLGGAARGVWPEAVAQEATPAAAEMEPEGISFAPVGFATGVSLANPADLFLVRVGIEPGASDVFDATDPSAVLVLVESGRVTVRLAVPWALTRGAGLDEALADVQSGDDLAAAMEAVAADAAVTLEAGDVAFIPGGVDGEIRNDEADRAELLGIVIGPPMAAAATPPA